MRGRGGPARPPATGRHHLEAVRPYSCPVEELIPTLARAHTTKIVLVVMDGLGGFRTAERGSELREAHTPNLDQLAKSGSSGVHTVVAPGVTPGSGAGHLALFGYDPLRYALGRGALSAAGVGFAMQPGDVAARVNFCTISSDGVVLDRRAGRIPTEEAERLCKAIRAGLDIGKDVEVFVEPEREHRALLVLRAEGLSASVSDTDPQETGLPARHPEALSPEAGLTVRLLSEVLAQVREILSGERANFILLRGFDSLRALPTFQDRYRLQALGIACYPMYIGIARLLGMKVAPPQPSFSDEIARLKESWADHDFFFIHHKTTDSAGEDGDFARKVASIEEVDASMPLIVGGEPDVLCVTGDHATPSQLRGHSWHPVPFVLWGPRVGVDAVDHFDEETARAGAFGIQQGKDLMGLMLGAADRLAKFGP